MAQLAEHLYQAAARALDAIPADERAGIYVASFTDLPPRGSRRAPADCFRVWALPYETTPSATMPAQRVAGVWPSEPCSSGWRVFGLLACLR
jgi:hypothetical protein